MLLLPPACILLPPAGCRCRCLCCGLPALLSTCAVHNCSTLLAVFPGLQRRFVTRSSSFNKEQFEELLAHSGILNGGQCVLPLLFLLGCFGCPDVPGVAEQQAVLPLLCLPWLHSRQCCFLLRLCRG